MGATKYWLVAVFAIAIGCNGTIGAKELTNGRSVDPGAPPTTPTDPGTDPPSPDPDTPPLPGVCADGAFPTPIPDCDPTPVPDSGDPYADCVARINQFRLDCQCLPPLERWVDGESCADGNAEYDSEFGFHASFEDQPCGTGARGQNECPGWASDAQVIGECLQVMWAEGPEDGDPGTINGHYESMASTLFTKVACGFYTTPEGAVWGVQNFD